MDERFQFVASTNLIARMPQTLATAPWSFENPDKRKERRDRFELDMDSEQEEGSDGHRNAVACCFLGWVDFHRRDCAIRSLDERLHY